MFHHEKNWENENVVSRKTDKRYSVIALADGVNTCSKARKGAGIASEAIANLFFKNPNCETFQIKLCSFDLNSSFKKLFGKSIIQSMNNI